MAAAQIVKTTLTISSITIEKSIQNEQDDPPPPPQPQQAPLSSTISESNFILSFKMTILFLKFLFLLFFNSS